MHKLKKGQIVYNKGDFANDMFFITKGQMHFALDDKSQLVFAKLETGEHFGEADIFNN